MKGITKTMFSHTIGEGSGSFLAELNNLRE
jgi:hypothetical protein